VSFLRRVSRPSVTALDDKKITAFQSIDDAVIIAHINPRDTHLQTGFKSLASRYRDRASFGTLKTTEDSSVVCYNNKDNEQSSTKHLAEIESLGAFVANCMKPLVGEFSRRNELKHLQVSLRLGARAGSPVCGISLTRAKSGMSLVYYLAETPEERESYVNLIRPLAKKYKEFLSFVTVDANEYESMAVALGLQHRSLPALSVQNPSRGQVFPFVEGDITPEAIDLFVQNIAAGNVQPWVSLPTPERAGYSHDEL
jgi:protein disulfide-isomerase A1